MLVAALLAIMLVTGAAATQTLTSSPKNPETTPVTRTGNVIAPLLLGRMPSPTAEVTAVSPTATPEQRTSSATDEPSTPTPTPTPTPELRPGPLPNYEAPLRLRIPAIGIDAHVQWVGRDDQGRMGVPSNYTDVAWYEPGPKPGNIGNAVIDGHLDSRDGPAVFYRLGDLQQGADVIVVTSDGIELRFIVDRVERYKTDDVPLSRVFGPSTGQHLNLITCEGTFDWNSRAYDERLVVYTTLAT